MSRYIIIGAALACLASAASATEAIDYSYDARGRLTAVTHGGSVNSGIVTTYQFDAADNRTSVTTTGSPFNNAPMRVIVVPLGTLVVLPIGPA